jgi:histone H3/H4
MLLPIEPFSRLVKEILEGVCAGKKMRMTASGFAALQTVTEEMMVKFLSIV